MKITLIATLAFMASGAAYAAHTSPTVELRSFRFAGQRTRAAEICGKVTGNTQPFTIVKVLVDPRSSQPGPYFVTAGPNGVFCASVVTYTGVAEASLPTEHGWTESVQIAVAPESDSR